MLLSVVMPVYNERATIKEIIQRVQAIDIPKEIIIVDDGSTDGTRELLQNLQGENIRVFYHEVNRGKGAAVRTGFQQVRGDVVIIQDSDLEYDPQDYYKLLEPLLDGRADAVFGSRFLGGPHRVLFFWHYAANKFLTLLSNMLTNLNLSDMETGFKAFRAEVVKSLHLKSNRFGFEPEVTAKLAKHRYRIYEVPISYSGRDYSEGKKITWRDGVAALYHIIRFRLFD
ncbi:MAG: glycosyltransferase family 2 protein [Nitrospinota bacterium]|nr:MAG: glycosyltransferase family 2 protein [Nitrospinota bacterium]